ncbi:MAG: SpoIIE family protein phosphatase, partial [Candidatus Latescibacteria bacterium]|nr:SpoIIE family protein phosphatase [Candidatus Latescibacterota bacterium]
MSIVNGVSKGLCGVWILVLGWSGLVAAEDGVARAWKTFRQEDGLAHNVVTTVTQTSDGAMWFATINGISRYDGQNWKTFTTQDGLPANMVRDLVVESNGVIWAAMSGRFLGDVKQAVARYANGKWEGLDTPKELFGRFGIRKFFASSPNTGGLVTDDGRLLLLSDGNLRLVRGEDGEVLRGAQSVLFTNDGQLWVSYGQGQRSMFRFGSPGGGRGRRGMEAQGIGLVNVETALWQPMPEFASVIREPVLSMVQESDGTIWFGTNGDGLWRYGQDVWTRFTVEDGLPSNRIQVVRPLSDGSLWVGTPAGAGFLREDGNWVVYSEREGLPNNFVEDIWLAADGAVWVGTRGGVGRFGTAGWVHHLNWPGKKDRGGTELVRDEAGTLWAGTASGLYKLEDNTWQEVEDLRERVRGPFLNFAVDGQGVLWGATSSHVLQFDGQRWNFIERYGSDRRRGMRSIAAAQKGGVWLVDRSGIYRFDGQKRETIEDVRIALALYEDTDGAMWIGGLDGAMRILNGERHIFTVADGMPEGPINSIVADKAGRIWVSTRFDGVAVFDAKKQSWKRVPGNMEAQFNGVRRIYPADDGTVWMASSIDGAIRTDGTVWTRYTVREGLPSSQVSDVCQDALGQLWFATEDGLACYMPDQDPPETYLISAQKQIAPHQSAAFEFVGQDAWKLTPESNLQFSWRLDSGDWSSFKRTSRESFDGLKPGDYQFEVRAMDLAFNIDTTPVLHTFHVLAPVWKRPWFIALSVLTLLLLAVTSGSAWQRHKRWRVAQAQLIDELESELQEAHEMQMGLLPRFPITHDGFDVAGRCWPANHVGGDYFTYYWLDDEQHMLGFGAADVSGKAMKAAVRAMQLSGIFRYEFREAKPPQEVLSNLHLELQSHLDSASFITCCLGMLDVRTGLINLGNAAHPFPYHYSAATGDLRMLELMSVPLGMQLPVGTNTDPEVVDVVLEPGDALILYSDGVTDMQTVA